MVVKKEKVQSKEVVGWRSTPWFKRTLFFATILFLVVAIMGVWNFSYQGHSGKSLFGHAVGSGGVDVDTGGATIEEIQGTLDGHDTNSDGIDDMWSADTNGDGNADVFGYDTDGDGQMDSLEIDENGGGMTTYGDSNGDGTFDSQDLVDSQGNEVSSSQDSQGDGFQGDENLDVPDQQQDNGDGIEYDGADQQQEKPDQQQEQQKQQPQGVDGVVTCTKEGEVKFDKQKVKFVCVNGKYLPYSYGVALLFLKSTTCPGGKKCDGSKIIGVIGETVCGTDLQNWKCTGKGWSGTGEGCVCAGLNGELNTKQNRKDVLSGVGVGNVPQTVGSSCTKNSDCDVGYKCEGVIISSGSPDSNGVSKPIITPGKCVLDTTKNGLKVSCSSNNECDSSIHMICDTYVDSVDSKKNTCLGWYDFACKDDTECISGFNCFNGKCGVSEKGLCTDTKDNDNDGKVDCADSDCVSDPACVSAVVSCPGGTKCDGTAVTGKLNDIVCGDKLVEYKCTAQGWAGTGNICSSCPTTLLGDTDGNGCLTLSEYTAFKKKYKNNVDNVQDTVTLPQYNKYKKDFKNNVDNVQCVS